MRTYTQTYKEAYKGGLKHDTHAVSQTLFISLSFVLFFLFEAATQLARQVHQERTQVVCSNMVPGTLARRHSRNGQSTHECCFEVDVFVC